MAPCMLRNLCDLFVDEFFQQMYVGLYEKHFVTSTFKKRCAEAF